MISFKANPMPRVNVLFKSWLIFTFNHIYFFQIDWVIHDLSEEKHIQIKPGNSEDRFLAFKIENGNIVDSYIARLKMKNIQSETDFDKTINFKVQVSKTLKQYYHAIMLNKY